MSARPVIRAVSGGLTRRKVQTVVIFTVLLVSTASATLGLGLLVDSNSPFQHAFAAQRGAEVTASIDPARATTGQLAATRRLPQVTAAAGPFAEATITPRVDAIGLTMPPVTVVGRASPGGPVDELTLDAGRWARRPGEIVISPDSFYRDASAVQLIGTRITVTSAPGRPVLKVVGVAKSITGTAGAWVVPAEIAALHPPHTPAAAQMLYRFHHADTQPQLTSDVTALTRALPSGTITGTSSWLTVKTQESGSIAIIVPFVVAFGVIGLAMSVVIVGNVVNGAVVSGYRRIGVLKSIGFTPAQVVAAYVAQAGIPALAGMLAGVVVGNVLSVPLLSQTATIYGVGKLLVPPSVDIGVPLLMCALVGLAALLPALRAGRLSAVAAIATGRAPRTGRGYAAHRLLGRLPLPRPVTIGLAAPFARPARTAVTMAAIGFGATAVIFAAGLNSSLTKAANGQSHAASEQVQISPALPYGPAPKRFPGFGGRRPLAAGHYRTVGAALRAQPGTLRWVAEAMPMVGVAGLTDPVSTEAFRGNAAWTGYDMISGRWYRAPGEVVVNTGFLTQTGKSVGDTVTLTFGGKQITARIVGEVFDPQGRGTARHAHKLADPGRRQRGADRSAIRRRPAARHGPKRLRGCGQPRAAPQLLRLRHHERSVLPDPQRADRHADPADSSGRRARRAQHGGPRHQGPGARPRGVQVGRNDAAADDRHGHLLDRRCRADRRGDRRPSGHDPALLRAAGHGQRRWHRDSGQLRQRLQPRGTPAPRPGRAGHRGGRRPAPG